MKILLTGFDPFGNESINPSIEAVKRCHVAGVEMIKIEVPTVFYESIDVVSKAIDQHQPDVVICVGQAGGRVDITIERVAININDARIPDNKGNQPIDQKIYEDGENAYFSSLPIKQIVTDLNVAGIPASVSNSAGTFVCNHLMYGIAHRYKNLKCGFVHVPFIPSQVTNKNAPSMSLEIIVRGLETIIETMKKDA